MGSRSKKNGNNNGATIGFEAKLWQAADKLRNNMDAAESKHVILGLIFLKSISDSFEEMHSRLSAGGGEYEGANPEDQDEYRAENVFWVPKEARWSYLQASAEQPHHRQADRRPWQADGKTRFVQVVVELSRTFALCAASDEAAAIRDDVSFFQAVQAGVRSPQSSRSAWRG